MNSLESQREERPEEWVKHIKMAVFDFDGTIARTFEKGPSGIDAHSAIEKAVSEVFGPEGMQAYIRIGGLQNRSPGELVDALLKNGDSAALVANARSYFNLNASKLTDIMAPEKGIALTWTDEPELQKQVMTELFVRAKLLELLPAIGGEGETQWPKPYVGVLETIRAFREKAVPVAILSAGHDEFIKRAFAMWGEECPYVVSDDDLRRLDFPADDRMKPSMFLMHLVHSKLIAKNWRNALIRHNEIGYFGDDPRRDGDLARRSKAKFGWYKPDANDEAMKNPAVFRDWNSLAASIRLGSDHG